MIGREKPSNVMPSIETPPNRTNIPESFPTITTVNHDESALTVAGTTTVTSNKIATASATNDVVGTTVADENQELSLLSLLDLEQAIEHVTELILNPSLIGRNSSAASTMASGVHRCHNTHLLVDGKVQWTQYFLPFGFRVASRDACQSLVSLAGYCAAILVSLLVSRSISTQITFY